jgi:mono/diheme cytochrome c family protein
MSQGRQPATLVAALLLGLAALASAQPVAITLPPDLGQLPPGPGRETIERACQTCHSLDYISTQPRGGEAQWRGVVTKMRTVYGAPLSDEDAAAIVRYLTSQFGASP